MRCPLVLVHHYAVAPTLLGYDKTTPPYIYAPEDDCKILVKKQLRENRSRPLSGFLIQST